MTRQTFSHPPPPHPGARSVPTALPAHVVWRRSRPWAVALLLALASNGAARAETADPPTETAAPEAMRLHNLAIPILEVPAVNLSLWALNRYALQADYAFISLESVETNLRSAWTLDADSFEVNQFGHPYQGALSFTAARSSGHGFWTSLLFPVAGSLLWEYALETTPPSLNDQITTPFAGALLGESLHRISSLILYNGADRPSLLRRILGAAVNPMGALNRYAFGVHPDDAAERPNLFAGKLQIGANLLGVSRLEPKDEPLVQRAGHSLALGVRLGYGLPNPKLRLERPFDHFDLDAELNLSAQPFGTLAMRGLLWGGHWDRGDLHGLGGLFAIYDFFNPTPFRVSSSAIGLGTTNVLSLGERSLLRVTALGGPVVLGAAGLSESTKLDRDYHLGPGGTWHLSTYLLTGRSLFEVSARHHLLSGIRLQKGWESILQCDVRGELDIAGGHGIGVRWTGFVRNARFTNGTGQHINQRGGLLRVYWTWRIGERNVTERFAEAPESSD